MLRSDYLRPDANLPGVVGPQAHRQFLPSSDAKHAVWSEQLAMSSRLPSFGTTCHLRAGASRATRVSVWDPGGAAHRLPERVQHGAPSRTLTWVRPSQIAFERIGIIAAAWSEVARRAGDPERNADRVQGSGELVLLLHPGSACGHCRWCIARIAVAGSRRHTSRFVLACKAARVRSSRWPHTCCRSLKCIHLYAVAAEKLLVGCVGATRLIAASRSRIGGTRFGPLESRRDAA
jgi:hypothetical protein